MDESALKVGFETVFSTSVVDGRVKTSFGEGWEEEVSGEELTNIVNDANAKLGKGKPPTKGIGKSKPSNRE